MFIQRTSLVDWSKHVASLAKATYKKLSDANNKDTTVIAILLCRC